MLERADVNRTLLRGVAYNLKAAAYDHMQISAQLTLKNDGCSNALAVPASLLSELEALIGCEMAEKYLFEPAAFAATHD